MGLSLDPDQLGASGAPVSESRSSRDAGGGNPAGRGHATGCGRSPVITHGRVLLSTIQPGSTHEYVAVDEGLHSEFRL